VPKQASTKKIIRGLRSGQITIPAQFRKALGIDEESYLEVTLGEGEVRIKPVRVTAQPKDSDWLQELYDYFAPARREAAQYSEEEINADIAAALGDVRRKHAQSRL
jgi:AbrB family looped-hinge helix DNA binding protein